MAKRPVEVPLPEKIVKLASGSDFVLFLGESGQVYSSGNGETGQLGRVNRYAAEDGRRGGLGETSFEIFSFNRRRTFCLERLITPAPIMYNRSSVKEKRLFFDDIFAGAHHYFLKVQGQSYILAGGLNNFHQICTATFILSLTSVDLFLLCRFTKPRAHSVSNPYPIIRRLPVEKI